MKKYNRENERIKRKYLIFLKEAKGQSEATAMNCTNGNCSVTVDYSGYPGLVRFDGTDINLNSVWVISDKGGSARYENINTR